MAKTNTENAANCFETNIRFWIFQSKQIKYCCHFDYKKFFIILQA
jgi:hypothetical protein